MEWGCAVCACSVAAAAAVERRGKNGSRRAKGHVRLSCSTRSPDAFTYTCTLAAVLERKREREKERLRGKMEEDARREREWDPEHRSAAPDTHRERAQGC